MNTNEKFERLLGKFYQLEAMEQTPQVILLREKLPRMIEKYEKMNRIEKGLNTLQQDYKELLGEAHKDIGAMERELAALTSKRP